jgi:hypothetical protein
VKLHTISYLYIVCRLQTNIIKRTGANNSALIFKFESKWEKNEKKVEVNKMLSLKRAFSALWKYTQHSREANEIFREYSIKQIFIQSWDLSLRKSKKEQKRFRALSPLT